MSVLSAAYRTARRSGLSQADAEDIAQATALIVWQNKARIDSPEAYAVRVAERAAWALAAHNRAVSPVDPSEIDRDGRIAPDVAAQAVGRVFVADVIGALPLRQAATLDLHYLRDLPLVQIAELLDVTINTVKTHNRLALESARRTDRKHK